MPEGDDNCERHPDVRDDENGKPRLRVVGSHDERACRRSGGCHREKHHGPYPSMTRECERERRRQTDKGEIERQPSDHAAGRDRLVVDLRICGDHGDVERESWDDRSHR